MNIDVRARDTRETKIAKLLGAINESKGMTFKYIVDNSPPPLFKEERGLTFPEESKEPKTHFRDKEHMEEHTLEIIETTSPLNEAMLLAFEANRY